MSVSDPDNNPDYIEDLPTCPMAGWQVDFQVKALLS